MRRVVFFFDGFNIYPAIDTPKYSKYKWLDYMKLAQCFAQRTDRIVDVYYFTAYATWNPEKMSRHLLYVEALETTGVRVVEGEFRDRERKCSVCKHIYRGHEEKQSDVNIAVKLFETAIDDVYDLAIIASADSDLVPALKGVRSRFPAKRIGVLFPIGRKSYHLKQVADFHMRMKERHLRTSQLNDVICLPDGRKIRKPARW